ncbi:1309_t:CDS:2 [Racocetra fulgida]|uniref:1309_t:CDS:1 n=1 Tax=Racocetra fulgida TaxID=60492 RepID=A0A9N9F3S6_9GLOM|nr:1309_t:CDS:2 [Racocetra fulgida]
MAIAIVYMAKEFKWNHTTQGLVSSSFYFGYITTQILGGVLTDKFGGRGVLSIGDDPRDYLGISKEELNWILKSKSSAYLDDNLDHYQSGSRDITITDDVRGILQSENDVLLPKDQTLSRPNNIQKIPWKLIFSRREVWAIILGQFCNSWGFFILLNWLPIYYYEHFM